MHFLHRKVRCLNVGFLNFASMTLPSIFKQKETLEYPFVKKEPYPGQKGRIVIDVDNCILCGKCSKACPCDALEVSRPKKTWAIDHFRCITCSSCIDACPKKCLDMDVKCEDVSRTKTIDTHSVNLPEKTAKPKANAIS